MLQVALSLRCAAAAPLPVNEPPGLWREIQHHQDRQEALPPLNAAQSEALATWQSLVSRRPPELLACLEASVALHQALPPIDAVAWDWIPAAPPPLLLDGNGGFGLLVPQLWQELARRDEGRAPGGGAASSAKSS